MIFIIELCGKDRFCILERYDTIEDCDEEIRVVHDKMKKIRHFASIKIGNRNNCDGPSDLWLVDINVDVDSDWGKSILKSIRSTLREEKLDKLL